MTRTRLNVKTTTLSEPIVADAAADMLIRESVLGRKSMGRTLGYAHGGAAGGGGLVEGSMLG
jgi:hypothetical protein